MDSPARSVPLTTTTERDSSPLYLAGFGDDSADETKQRVFTVACVVATEEVWWDLEGSWVARNSSIPFHATDCECNQGDYKDRSNQENKDLYKDCATMLAYSGAWGFGVSVDLAGHRECFPNVHEELSYHFCFLRVVDRFAAFAAEQRAGRIEFSFDNRLDVNFNAELLYSGMVNDETQPHREVLHDKVSFLSSRRNPRMQVADLWARECMKYLDNIVGPEKRPERKSMTALLETGRFGADLYMREYFEDKRKRFSELEKKAGFNQQTYVDWLCRHKLVDNVSNMFRFITSVEFEDDWKKKGTKEQGS